MNGISFAKFEFENEDCAKRSAGALRGRTAWKISRERNLVSVLGIVVRTDNEDDLKEALFDYRHFVIVCGGIGSVLVDWGTLEVGLSSTTISTPDWSDEIGVMYIPASATLNQYVDVFSETLGIGHYLGRGVVTEDGIRLVRELTED